MGLRRTTFANHFIKRGMRNGFLIPLMVFNDVVELFDTFRVFTRAGIDLDAFAFFDEERHTNLDARFDGSVLHGVGSGVAGKARFGVSNHSLDEGRQLAKERCLGVGMHGNLNILTLFQELGGIDDGLFHANLLERLGVHEVVQVGFLVKISVGTAFDTDDVDFGSRGESVLKDTARLDVTHLGADESGAFAGFYMKEFDDGVNVVVKIDTKTILNICSCCHKILFV